MAQFAISELKHRDGGDFGLRHPWAPVIDSIAPDDASWGPNDGQATMTIQIYFGRKELSDTVCDILGYAERVNNLLRRKPPMKHPIFHWMHAERISSVKFLGPAVSRAAIGDGLGDNAAVSAHLSTPLGNIHNWQRVNITIVFRSLPYPVKTDLYIDSQKNGEEWYRFVEKRPRSATKWVTADRNDYKFRDTAAPSNGKAIKQGVAILIHEQLIEWKWMYVPHKYIYGMNSTDDGIAPNIEAAAGCVNEIAFAGHPAGTLLLEKPDIQEAMMPAPIDGGFGPVEFVEAPRMCHVSLGFRKLDPPRSPTRAPIDENSVVIGDDAARGHLVLPDPQSPDGYWYYVRTDGGRPLYRRYKFQKIFAPAPEPAV